MNRQLFIPLLVFVALCVLLYQGLSMDPRLLPSELVDEPVPAFSLPALDGGATLGAENLKGKPRLLNVWATWCPSCYTEHPYLLTLAKEQGVSIVGLNYKDEPAKARDYLARLGNPYETVISDEPGRLGIDLGVYGAPETFVIDAKGVVRFRFVGVIDERSWNKELKPVLDRLQAEQD
ncbi:MAG: DsbE family thiol:disulfide interchange protein [Gammaproteobacteria bacterium]|nr:DsbE family thiol:disulfide interchange protein [Gammaproteobacteria bacterium]